MDIKKIEKLTTEARNADTLNIDSVSTLDMLKLINNEDKKVAFAVEKALDRIAEAVDEISKRLSKGGRLFYVGAGTSGRLGIVDSSECPPTFGVEPSLVQGLIAGGETAFIKAVEGAEDDAETGKLDLLNRGITSKDVVCGIAASGRTPYVIGAMKYGDEIGAAVISVTMNSESEMSKIAHIPIDVVVGPEALTGSTRMKSGTAQKLVLNMLTTGTMIKLGKVYSNLMVDLQATNEKLIVRSKRIVMIATDVDEKTAAEFLIQADNSVKLAIFMIKSGLDKESAEKVLEENKGYIQRALDAIN